MIPAIIAMLLTNENDVTHHFGNALLPDKNVPRHNALYMAQAENFAAQYGLPKDKTWRSWEHGPSKLFLNDLENRFNVGMIGAAARARRQGAGRHHKHLGRNPLSSLPALTSGRHDRRAFLWRHRRAGKEPDLRREPHALDRRSTGGRPPAQRARVERLAVPGARSPRDPALYRGFRAACRAGTRLCSMPIPNKPLTNAGGPSNWHAFNDPALIATLPAAALLYRRGDVREAHTTYAFAPTRDQLFNEPISPANAVALRTAAEKGKLVIALPATRELPWLEPSPIPAGAKVLTDPRLSLIEVDASEAVSDTGELRRNWDHGIYTIDTPRTQAAMGWIGGKDIRLADVDIGATTRNATVAVQSLDESAISKSRAIMISLGARSVPKTANQLPFHSEPVTGRLSIRAPKGLRLTARSGPARGEREIPAIYEGGRYHIELDPSLATYWLMLK